MLTFFRKKFQLHCNDKQYDVFKLLVLSDLESPTDQ